MQVISPNGVANVRAVALWSVRAVATVSVLAGLYLLIHRVLFATLTMDWYAAIKSFQGVGTFQPFHAGVTLTLLGVVVGLLSRPLASWIVAVPAQGCPRCGYPRARETTSPDPTRCTECGLSGVNAPRRDEP